MAENVSGIIRDGKGRVVPGAYFGVDYGIELDSGLEPLPDSEYTKMAKEGREASRRSLEESGYQNQQAFKVGYEIEKAQDKVEEMGNNRFLGIGKKKYMRGVALLGAIVDDLKVVPSGAEVPDDVGERVNGVLKLLRIKKYSTVGLHGGFGGRTHK